MTESDLEDEGSADDELKTTSCFLTNQPNARVICRACSNETLNETNSASITWWCIDPNGNNPVCGNTSEVFQDDNNGFRDVTITPDGNVVLTYARGGYHNKELECTRLCSDHQLRKHVITLSVESTKQYLYVRTLYMFKFIACVYVCVHVCTCACMHVCCLYHVHVMK